MLRVARSAFAVSLYSSLFLLVFSQTTRTSVESPAAIYTADSVQWPAPVPDGGLLLTVSGPQNLYLRQDCPAGNWARFSLSDELGQVRPDGVYKWELVVQAEGEARVGSGWFRIQGGRVVAEGAGEQQPVVVEQSAPENSLYVDGQGRLGVGTSVPQSQLHLKGSSPAFTLEDTTTGGRVFALRGLEKGDGSLGLFDQTTGEARWLIDSQGRMGINTTKPTSTLTVDGYIEATKGFLVNGRPMGEGIGLPGVAQPLFLEGSYNSFFGTGAGAANTVGSQNSFFGAQAGAANTSGFSNSFFGWGSGGFNTTGFSNSFVGLNAGGENTSGYNNAALGQEAGVFNSTGSFNSFVGYLSGGIADTGSYRTSIGALSSAYGTDATAIGAFSIASGVNATAIGSRSCVQQSDSLVLGSIPGYNNATSYVNVGIGTAFPARQLHLAGPNAVVRMDRSADTAALLLIRTDSSGRPWKGFVVGTNASGPDQGEFIINDIGTAEGGGGNRRMTISNEGNVEFTGTVTALDFASPSSIALKTNVRTLDDAIATVNRLRGVRFDWKESGKAAVGLIAEEVDEVVPEVVAHEGSKATGVNYANLVAVLVEAVKEQQKTIRDQQKANEEQQKTLERLERQQDELRGLKTEVDRLKLLLQER